jgi:ribosome maturation factor RimP
LAHDDVLQHVEKIIEDMGLLLVDANLFQAGRRRILRVLVDRKGRVSLDQCAEVSRAIGSTVETLNLIEGPYTLEVSSPGIGRPLATENDWIRCCGRKIEVKTDDGEYTGMLSNYGDGVLLFEDGNEIQLDSILAAREVI